MRKRLSATSLILVLVLPGCDLHVTDVKQLDGCYEGVGLPDFMRPSVHWVFRIKNGVVIDRSGTLIAKVALGLSGPKSTQLLFSPAISLFENEHKEMMVQRGNIWSAWAQRQRSEISLVLQDDGEQQLLQTTSCS